MGAPVKGRADYLLLGDYNAACSMCGRKRKASQLVRNWQGLYRCPEHNEPRQPQDFVRNVKDVMTVPWAQPEQNTFTNFVLTFPAWVNPSSVDQVIDSPDIVTTGVAPLIIETTGDSPEAIQATGTNLTTIPVQILVPNWVNVYSYLWSWFSGGDGISINSPEGNQTSFTGAGGLSGVALCLVTSILENATDTTDIFGKASVYVPVNIPS